MVPSGGESCQRRPKDSGTPQANAAMQRVRCVAPLLFNDVAIPSASSMADGRLSHSSSWLIRLARRGRMHMRPMSCRNAASSRLPSGASSSSASGSQSSIIEFFNVCGF